MKKIILLVSVSWFFNLALADQLTCTVEKALTGNNDRLEDLTITTEIVAPLKLDNISAQLGANTLELTMTSAEGTLRPRARDYAFRLGRIKLSDTSLTLIIPVPLDQLASEFAAKLFITSDGGTSRLPAACTK